MFFRLVWSSIRSASGSQPQFLAIIQRRHAHIVKHAKPLPVTPPGHHQRAPSEKQEFQMYEEVQDSVNEYPPVKVILLKSVDGIGRRGDVVSVSSEEYHNLLFPTGAAIYATPYDLKLLEQRREAGDFAKLAPEDMVSYEHKKLARTLNSTIVKITMTFDDTWTLEKRHLRINLRRAGFIVSEDNIVMPKEKLKGPNKNLQGQVITFYVKHTPHCIVPVLGQIDQVSAKGHQLIVAAADVSKDTEQPLAPPVYYSSDPLELSDEEIRSLMASRNDSTVRKEEIAPAS